MNRQLPVRGEPRLLRAMAHRNFRLYFAGQTCSLIGTWVQSTAMPWLIARLTESPAWVGVAGFWAQLPSLFCAPFAGVVADHADRHRLLMVTQLLAMGQALALAALVGGGSVQVWQVVMLNAVLSAVNAFDMTARQAFLGDMLDTKDDLANAIALNSSMVGGARLIGPSLAAWLIVQFGEAGCFLVNALSFAAVLASLLAMRVRRRERPTARLSVWTNLREGCGYAAATPDVRLGLGMIGLMSLVGLPYVTLMPFYVREDMGAGPEVYGLLMTAPGVGAFAASWVLAWLGLRGIRVRIGLAMAAAGVCLAAFSTRPGLIAAAGLLFGAGFSFLMVLNSGNSLIQTVVPDAMRGRVMSLYTMAFIGLGPVGSLAVGALAEVVGVPAAMRWCGGACAAAGLAVAARQFQGERGASAP